MEKKRLSETCKGFRTTETHGRSIYDLYMPVVSCRSIVSIEMPCFFPKAPRRSSPIDLALCVVSRKRLPDYVCPATDGDADERTSGLYIVPPDLKPPRILFFSFSSSSSSFFFLASSSSSSSRLTGRCASLYRDCISIAMPPARRCIRPFVRLAYRLQRREYRKDSHLYYLYILTCFIHDRVTNTSVYFFFSWWKSLPVSISIQFISRYLVSELSMLKISPQSLLKFSKSYAAKFSFAFQTLSEGYHMNATEDIALVHRSEIRVETSGRVKKKASSANAPEVRVL